ncbi:hypothetical protein bcere0025_56040 [Bacillus cereus F65185]|nr:hypothetical protein bcere0025_56040 [Bacillus cereus F65185]
MNFGLFLNPFTKNTIEVINDIKAIRFKNADICIPPKLFFTFHFCLILYSFELHLLLFPGCLAYLHCNSYTLCFTQN